MDIRYLFEDFLDRKNFQTWINNRFKNPDKVIIDSIFFELFPILTMSNGVQFYNSPEIREICEVFKDYRFFDIKMDDRVIDIGANVGGFAIPASKLSKYTFAVEPLLGHELRRNAELNKANITILEGALGDGRDHNISWGNVKKVVNTYTFSSLKDICKGCDFLKCDCEGYEWFIKPEELKGIRRLEIELHNVNPSNNDPYLLIDEILKNYETVIISKNGRIIDEFQMNFRKNVTDLVILHANKKTE